MFVIYKKKDILETYKLILLLLFAMRVPRIHELQKHENDYLFLLYLATIIELLLPDIILSKKSESF